MSDTVITVENLSKCYSLGHQSGRRGRYTAMRDVIAQGVRDLARRVAHPIRGRQTARGGQVEEFWALKDINFEVKQGEILGVIGRNGAGKSTLLKILSRITEPTKGRVVLRGRAASLLEVGIGFHPELTGRENIYLNGAILGMTQGEISRRFDEIVAFADVERFIDTPVKRYSSGMYVRLAFAVAAHLEPEILIVDEVLAVGDAGFQKQCLGKINEVSKKGGRTVLLVSHNMLAIENLCERTILLEAGKKIADGETASVVRRYMDGFQKPDQRSSLSEANRKGRGRVRFVSVGFEDEDGNAVEQGKSGRQLTVVLNYQSAQPQTLGHVYRIGLTFANKMGQVLFNCATEVSSTDTVDLPPTGSVRCVIPRLPLSQSEYLITLFLEVNREVEDWIEGALTLQVLDGDFFGSGKIYPEGWQGLGVLVSHYWVL